MAHALALIEPPEQRDHWERRFLDAQERGFVPAGRIKSVAEVCESEHLRARGMFVRLAHPKAGAVTAMGVPIRLWDTPGAAQAPAPLLGQHTDQILRDVVGMSEDEIGALREKGVLE